MSSESFHLFERFGVELEYMIVRRPGLDVWSVTDKVIERHAGEITDEVEAGGVSWSNELVLHVIELKASEPSPTLSGLAGRFQEHVGKINAILEGLPGGGGRLMPSAMHPWMDPDKETRLWPHGNGEIYEAFNRIFDCRGHGWANLQSMHLNLPFASADRPGDEFGRLHAAVRLLLPILPALAASSPVLGGVFTGTMDNRLAVYRTNARRVPSVSGWVVPEPVFTREDYEKSILGRIYRDMQPLDHGGLLRHEWCNARGAIARFERDTIEIRVLDVQECPAADLAIAAAVVAVLRDLVGERWLDLERQQAFGTERLASILFATTEFAEATIIRDPEYLAAFGLDLRACSAGELWAHLIEASVSRADGFDEEWRRPLATQLKEGSLARRIARALEVRGTGPVDPDRLRSVYARLCECLARGEMFSGR